MRFGLTCGNQNTVACHERAVEGVNEAEAVCKVGQSAFEVGAFSETEGCRGHGEGVPDVGGHILLEGHFGHAFYHLAGPVDACAV